MKKSVSRILSALLALTMLASFCLSAFAADVTNAARSGFDGNITTDPSATDDGVVFNEETGDVTMKSDQTLRLKYIRDLPEDTDIRITWSSENEEVASIAADGTVTVGTSCKFSCIRIFKLPIPIIATTILPYPNRSTQLYIPIPILTRPRYEGSTTITMTITIPATDPETGETFEQTRTDTVSLTVQHTFTEWLRSGC